MYHTYVKEKWDEGSACMHIAPTIAVERVEEEESDEESTWL
mgnify:CR=1 FL=1